MTQKFETEEDTKIGMYVNCAKAMSRRDLVDNFVRLNMNEDFLKRNMEGMKMPTTEEEIIKHCGWCEDTIRIDHPNRLWYSQQDIKSAVEWALKRVEDHSPYFKWDKRETAEIIKCAFPDLLRSKYEVNKMDEKKFDYGTLKEAVHRWDNKKSVWSIEMGGLGPGYEQCIQVMIFEMCKHCLNLSIKAEEPKLFEEEVESIISKLDKQFGGFSGAQIGVAKQVAFRFLTRGYNECLNDEAIKNRKIHRRLYGS